MVAIAWLSDGAGRTDTIRQRREVERLLALFAHSLVLPIYVLTHLLLPFSSPQAARGGQLEAVKLLVENGADFNAKTAGNGGTVLWWARRTHGEDHPVIDFLEELGALEVGPEL